MTAAGDMRVTLARHLVKESDLRTLCSDLRVDFGALSGESVRDRVESLVYQQDKTGHLGRLWHFAVQLLGPEFEQSAPELDKQFIGDKTYLDIASATLLPPPGAGNVLRNPEKMYLPIRCATTRTGGGDDALRLVRDQLPTHEAVLILGDYGTGKSFLVRHLFLEMSKAYRSGRSRERLPVLLPLKQLQGMGDDLALTRIVEQLRLLRFFDRAGLARADEREMVLSWMKAGRFLCILDGFDEIPLLSVRYDPLGELDRLLKCLQLGDNRVLITTRPGVVPNVLTDEFANQRPELGIVHMLPWVPPEDRWPEYLQQAVRCGIAFPHGMERFRDGVLAREELRQLTVTPLYCQMLVETRDRILEASEMNVAKLYGMYTADYFKNVRERSLVRDQFPDERQEVVFKQRCLGATAVGMLESQSPRLNAERIESSLSWVAHLFDMDKLMRFVEKETLIYSLLVPDSDAEYSFSHKSFYEYYLACEIEMELDRVADDRTVLINKALMPKEVVVFLAGLITDDSRFAATLNAMFKQQRPLSALGVSHRPILLRNLTVLQLERTGALCQIDLRGLDFSGYEFSRRGCPVGLVDVKFDNCKLERASFRGCDLRKSSMRGAALNRCNLDDASLGEVDLTGTKLYDVHCSGTNWSGAKLEAVNLTTSDAERIRQAIEAEHVRSPDRVDRQWIEKTLQMLDSIAITSSF